MPDFKLRNSNSKAVAESLIGASLSEFGVWSLKLSVSPWDIHSGGGVISVAGLRSAGSGAAAALEAADGADGHVVIAEDLARQADAGHALGGEHLLLGDGHSLGFALDELDAAGRAAGVAAAGMEDVDPGVLLDRQHQPLAVLDFDVANPSTVSFGINDPIEGLTDLRPHAA